MIIKYFILGILFIEIVLPIIESAVSVICSWLEVLKGYASYFVSKINVNIQKLSFYEDEPRHQIGFVAPPVEEDEEEIY